MEFEYTDSIYISEKDLDYMARNVAKGKHFGAVYYDIMVGYDDADFYNRDNIRDDVEKEVMKRVKEM